MFKQVNHLRLPQKPIEAFSVQSASFGGGYIVTLVIEGRNETLVFSDISALTQYIQLMLSGQALALGGKPDAPEAPAPAPAKNKGGRPRLSEEEKAANRARRIEAKKNEVPEAALAA